MKDFFSKNWSWLIPVLIIVIFIIVVIINKSKTDEVLKGATTTTPNVPANSGNGQTSGAQTVQGNPYIGKTVMAKDDGDFEVFYSGGVHQPRHYNRGQVLGVVKNVINYGGSSGIIAAGYSLDIQTYTQGQSIVVAPNRVNVLA